MEDDPKTSPETWLANGLHTHDQSTGAVMPAIHPSTTFARTPDYELINPAHIYARAENPTFRLPERMIAELEGAADARIFGSGMSAASIVFQTLRSGDHIVLPREMYYNLRAWVHEFAERFRIEITSVPAGNLDALRDAMRPGKTKLVWIETPSNPVFIVTSIADAAEIAHAAGARLAVDGTVATPFHTQPLLLGADIVMHSTTKSLNGHSDVLGGALATREDDDHWRMILRERENAGGLPGPMDAWLLQRGLRTFFVRMHKASTNALALAQSLEAHPLVSAVHYPGLESHPAHRISSQQMTRGFGSLLAFEVVGGAPMALSVARHCEVITRATSLGGVESLIEHRASIEGPESPVPEGLLRVSVGIESADDLRDDLMNALALAGEAA
ncbi:MAG: PLP-dependent aspartate aminotransferase family protein [Pseudomonadota bacterium]